MSGLCWTYVEGTSRFALFSEGKGASPRPAAGLGCSL